METMEVFDGRRDGEAERLCISFSLSKSQGVPEKGLLEMSQTQEIIKHSQIQSEERDLCTASGSLQSF